MKNFIFILTLLISTLLMAQQDTTRQTFKIGKCGPYVAGKRKGKINKERLLAARKIEMRWCDDTVTLTGFKMTIQYSTLKSYALVDSPIKIEETSTSANFTSAMVSDIRKAPKGSTIFIEEILYTYHGVSGQKLGIDIVLTIE